MIRKKYRKIFLKEMIFNFFGKNRSNTIVTKLNLEKIKYVYFKNSDTQLINLTIFNLICDNYWEMMSEVELYLATINEN